MKVAVRLLLKAVSAVRVAKEGNEASVEGAAERSDPEGTSLAPRLSARYVQAQLHSRALLVSYPVRHRFIENVRSQLR